VSARRLARRAAPAAFAAVTLAVLVMGAACVGTTGSGTVRFDAAAAGPADATGGPLTFTSGRGYDVTLTRAVVHVGAVYLDQTMPASGSQETACTLPGTYVAEVTSGRDVDVLSPTPQPFPDPGDGTRTAARAAQVWLTGGAVDEVDDPTVILSIAGVAARDGATYPFEGKVTIERNRLPASTDPSLPGAHPICKERIVSPIPVALAPRAAGGLLVRVDPRGFFTNVEFRELEKVSDDPALFRFSDDAATQPSANLYAGLRASTGVYTFVWSDAL
jgi:hypothetical protein